MRRAARRRDVVPSFEVLAATRKEEHDRARGEAGLRVRFPLRLLIRAARVFSLAHSRRAGHKFAANCLISRRCWSPDEIQFRR